MALLADGVSSLLIDGKLTSGSQGTFPTINPATEEVLGAAADAGGHPPGAGIDSFDRVDIEVGEGGTTHLGIADVGAVHGKGRFHSALAVDGKLRGEVGGAIGIGHGHGISRGRARRRRLAGQQARGERDAGDDAHPGGAGGGHPPRAGAH